MAATNFSKRSRTSGVSAADRVLGMARKASSTVGMVGLGEGVIRTSLSGVISADHQESFRRQFFYWLLAAVQTGYRPARRHVFRSPLGPGAPALAFPAVRCTVLFLLR